MMKGAAFLVVNSGKRSPSKKGARPPTQGEVAQGCWHGDGGTGGRRDTGCLEGFVVRG